MSEEDEPPSFVPEDPTVGLYPEPLCGIFNSLARSCMEDSILELFGHEGEVTEEHIKSLTDQEILDTINEKTMRYFKHHFYYRIIDK